MIKLGDLVNNLEEMFEFEIKYDTWQEEFPNSQINDVTDFTFI